jgi:hypothetical protein
MENILWQAFCQRTFWITPASVLIFFARGYSKMITGENHFFLCKEKPPTFAEGLPYTKPN